MQRRTIVIIVVSVTAALLLLCGVAGGLGYVAINRLEQQSRDLADAVATIAASPAASAVTVSPTATVRPTDEPSATPITSTTVTIEPSASDTPPAASATSSENDGAVSEMDAQTAALVAASLNQASQRDLAEKPDATLYRIDAALDPEQRTISGTQTVRLINTEDTPLDEVYFRLYVNAPHYNEGGITVEDVRVNGAPAQTAPEVGDTALKVALPQPLDPGEEVEIAMRFTATVPTSGGGYGIFNEALGVFTLYNWHPEVAVYENGGWLLNPVSDQGDPTNTDASNYEVTFAAPEGYTVVTSGVESNKTDADGLVAHTYGAALTRNFVVVASDRYQSASQQVGDVEVNSYYLPDDQQGGKATLETAAKAIEVFSKQFGPYPYAELDVTEIKLGGGAAGMESTGLIMIGSDYYDPKQGNPLGQLGGVLEGSEGANVLAFTTAHEVAHQWWYGVVGSDAYKQPWLDESLTNWSAALYVDQTEGSKAGALARDLFIGIPYREALSKGDQRLDQPVDRFDEQGYGSIVYGKGALMYDVLRKELGDQKFFEFLKRSYDQQQFDRADGQEWLQTLNAVAGKDMTPFYRKWVEGDEVQLSDLPPGGPLSELMQGQLGGLMPEASPSR